LFGKIKQQQPLKQEEVVDFNVIYANYTRLVKSDRLLLDSLSPVFNKNLLIDHFTLVFYQELVIVANFSQKLAVIGKSC